jgi:hypothetical protein
VEQRRRHETAQEVLVVLGPGLADVEVPLGQLAQQRLDVEGRVPPGDCLEGRGDGGRPGLGGGGKAKG